MDKRQTSSISQFATDLYSALKAHKFTAELLEQAFEKHPVMAPTTFNGFLFSERASHGDVKRLDLKIGDLSNLLRGLQDKDMVPCDGLSPGHEEI